ncbi:MAG: purine-binding chemotaxis protein CheW [Myxococcales bacterium]|nr:purine-binding chemotaxis protein CheW [Myxococcales bacterium]
MGTLEQELERLRAEVARARGDTDGGPRAPEADPRALLVFRVGGARLAVDLARVVEAVRMVAPTPIAERSPAVLGVVDYRGKVVPLLDPAPQLGLRQQKPGLDTKIVVALACGRLLGLVVDDIEGLEEVAPGAYQRRADLLPTLESLAGRRVVHGTLRTDGELTLVLELDQLLAPEEHARLADAALRAAGADPASAADGATPAASAGAAATSPAGGAAPPDHPKKPARRRATTARVARGS